MHALTLLLNLIFGTLSFAGGISGGGGDISNPTPVAPAAIEEAVTQIAGPAVLSWLHAREAAYLKLSGPEQLASPYRKLFAGRRTIYDVIQSTRAELRFDSPCRDANGEAKDGSAFSAYPNAICLSAHRMASKLRPTNVREETLALLVHEFSHLLGTEEAEAEAIQWEALTAFTETGLLDLLFKINNSASYGALGMAEGRLQYFRESPTYALHLEFVRLDTLLLQTRGDLLFGYKDEFQFVRPHRFDEFRATDVYFSSIALGACAKNRAMALNDRKSCQEAVVRGFGDQREINALVYLNRFNRLGQRAPDRAYAKIRLLRIRGLPSYYQALLVYEKYLLSFRQDVARLAATKVSVIRN